jgi:NAD(P)-dependent dehydrogenase (short-subunit alcohol dehydrogenase family)
MLLMTANRRLENCTAVIVHIGSDLARACALRFVEEGAAVMAVDPSDDILRKFAETVSERGGTCFAEHARPGSETDIARVAARCDQIWKSVDILMICASALDWWEEDTDTMAGWEEIIRVNLLMPVFYTKAMRSALARSGRGSVIYYGSVDGIRGNPRLPAYSASRGGLIPFTHIAAHEYGPQGIRVNCIAGAAISPAEPDARPSHRGPMWNPAQALRATPLGRTATPADIANTALFLASSESSYLTGEILTVDGGRTAITPGTGLEPQ